MNSEMKYDSRMKINMTEKTSVEKTWKAYLNKIEPADRTAMKLAKKRWNSVAKPIGSLGILEEDIIKIAGIRGNASGYRCSYRLYFSSGGRNYRCIRGDNSCN